MNRRAEPAQWVQPDDIGESTRFPRWQEQELGAADGEDCIPRVGERELSRQRHFFEALAASFTSLSRALLATISMMPPMIAMMIPRTTEPSEKYP